MKKRIQFLPLLILAMLVNILGQTFHETGHHMVYQIMGHDPVWGFTKVVQIWNTQPINPDAWVETSNSEGEPGWLKLSSPIENKVERVIATAAGPLTGLVGAILGFVIAYRSKKHTWKQIGLALSLSSSLVAGLYYLRSPIRVGSDEYDIAKQVGIAKQFIEIPLAIAFIACLAISLRELPTWRIRLGWLGTVFLGSVATGLLMVMADDLVIAQVNMNNPWFQPIFGYSLPVFLTNGVTLMGLWIWSHWQAITQMAENFVEQ